MNEHFAPRRKRSLRYADFADQALRAGDHFIPPGFQRDRHQECGDETKRNADAEGGQQMYAHLRNRRIDQQQSAQREQRDAADGEHAVAGEFGFGGEKRKRAQNERQRGEARR